MLNNLMFIDRERMNNIDTGSFLAIANMDFILVREDDGTFTFLKDRYEGSRQTGMTYDQVQDAIRQRTRKYGIHLRQPVADHEQSVNQK